MSSKNKRKGKRAPLKVQRLPVTFSSDIRRVITRFFDPGGEARISSVVERVRSLSDVQVDRLLKEVYSKFHDRHDNIPAVLQENYRTAVLMIGLADDFSDKRRLLIGSYSMDISMEEVEVFECYLRADMDDDGIAELRKVVYAGNEILSDEEIDLVPFHSLCPIPIPHKFFGNSLADRAMDIQLIKSTITRQILDNLYLTNNARTGVVEGQVNLDDMLSVAPGGVIRMKNPNAIVPINVSPVANQAFPMLEYLDNIQSKRTGISDMQQGLNPDILQNVTAAAIAATQSASSGKIELIARIFAETGVKSLFKGILHLVTKYQDKPRMIRLRGKYVPIDPRTWSNQYDLSISVGLGTGNKQEQMAMLQMVMAKQEQIIQQYGPANPMVSIGQYRTTMGKFIEAAGFKDVSEFFKEITPEQDQALSNPPPQQQQQDPAIEAMIAQSQAQMQMAQQKLMADIEANRQKALADIQLAREKAGAEIQLEREKAAAQLELKKAEFEVEAQLKAAKVGAGIAANVEIPG